jgi:sec-independent protein translocase protein TatB
MFEVGFSELLLIMALALVVLGPEKLPKVVSQVGRWMGRARSMARQFREQLEDEATLTPTTRRNTTPAPEPAGTGTGTGFGAAAAAATAGAADTAASPGFSHADSEASVVPPDLTPTHPPVEDHVSANGAAATQPPDEQRGN